MSDEPEEQFSLTLKGGGINIDKKISQQTALRVVQVVLGADMGNIPQSPGQSSAPTADTALSLREYLDKIGATKKPEQITTIAHYIAEYEKQNDFDREAIRSRFITAREPLPANFPRDFGVALKNGWLAAVHGKKNSFYVTAKGVQAIGRGFSDAKR